MSFTRRTHVVRVHDDAPNGGGSYIDVEVLDAIAFRIDGNKEVILNMDQKKAVPFIVDNTGGGHGKTPGGATQRTHMTRVTGQQNPTNMLDVEVADCCSFRDQNGEEWILDMQNGSGDGANVFDATSGGGSAGATRRVHDEIVAPNMAKKADAGANYLTSQRSDAIAFRKANGYEVIIKCPSCDDPNAGVDFGRASTFVTPNGYDPADPTSPEPPTLAESGDAHIYAAFVPAADGFLTDDAKIAMGPFWWVRKVTSGSILFVEISYSLSSSSGPPSEPSIQLSHMSYNPSQSWDVLSTVNDTIKGVTNIPAIVNPVTDAMLAAYNAWTPAPKFEQRANNQPGGPQSIWYLSNPTYLALVTGVYGVDVPAITKDTYKIVVPGWGTVASIYGGGRIFYFTGDTSNSGTHNFDGGTLDGNSAAIAAGFDLSRLASLETQGNVFFNQADAEYLLAAYLAIVAVFGSSGDGARALTVNGTPTIQTFQVAQGGGGNFILAGAAVFAINLGSLSPKNGKMTFEIDVEIGTEGSVGVSAQAFRKLRDFSIDEHDAATFPAWGNDPPTPADGGKGGSSGVGSAGGGSFTIVGSIDAKTLDVTFA